MSSEMSATTSPFSSTAVSSSHAEEQYNNGAAKASLNGGTAAVSRISGSSSESNCAPLEHLHGNLCHDLYPPFHKPPIAVFPCPSSGLSSATRPSDSAPAHADVTRNAVLSCPSSPTLDDGSIPVFHHPKTVIGTTPHGPTLSSPRGGLAGSPPAASSSSSQTSPDMQQSAPLRHLLHPTFFPDFPPPLEVNPSPPGVSPPAAFPAASARQPNNRHQYPSAFAMPRDPYLFHPGGSSHPYMPPSRPCHTTLDSEYLDLPSIIKAAAVPNSPGGSGVHLLRTCRPGKPACATAPKEQYADLFHHESADDRGRLRHYEASPCTSPYDSTPHYAFCQHIPHAQPPPLGFPPPLPPHLPLQQHHHLCHHPRMPWPPLDPMAAAAPQTHYLVGPKDPSTLQDHHHVHSVPAAEAPHVCPLLGPSKKGVQSTQNGYPTVVYRHLPRVDVGGDADKLVIEVELPGVEKTDVRLHLDEDRIMTVWGVHKMPATGTAIEEQAPTETKGEGVCSQGNRHDQKRPRAEGVVEGAATEEQQEEDEEGEAESSSAAAHKKTEQAAGNTKHEHALLGGNGRKKEDTTWHVRERRKGLFERSIRLPASVAMEQVSANFDNGVLTIVVPKKPKSLKKGRGMEISIS